MSALKRMLITAGVLVVVGVGLVVGDSIARAAAQDRVAAAMQQQLGLEKPPTVELGGVPFLASLVTRTIPDARISAVDVPMQVAGKKVKFDRVDVTAEGISAGDKQLQVANGWVEATASYQAVSELAGAPVTAGSKPGQLQVNYATELPVIGKVEAVVTAVPMLSLDGSRVLLTDASIQVADRKIDPQLAQQLLDRMVKPIPLKLPYGLKPESIKVTPNGLVVTVTASDLTVPLP